MATQQDFDNLIEKLKAQRDEVNLKLHLATMEVKAEFDFDAVEQQWNVLKTKAAEIADDSVETSEEFIAKAKIIGEELKDTYHRIAQRLTE